MAECSCTSSDSSYEVKNIKIAIESLQYGGIIASYECTATCPHCLYACSPKRRNDYICVEMVRHICFALREKGCDTIHIGGGEPFVNLEGLVALAKVIIDEGIKIKFVETNAFWVNDYSIEVIEMLQEIGVSALSISIDPFHLEYIPYGNPLLLARLCKEVGMKYGLWKNKYVKILSALDSSITYTYNDLEDIFKNVDIVAEYGVTYGGRAISFEKSKFPRWEADELANSQPCKCLSSGNHFHVDLYGRYIPAYECTGIFIPLNEIVVGLPSNKYPVFEALYENGIMGLYRYALSKCFIPDPTGYSSTCAMCFYIRGWLSRNAPSPELDTSYYMASFNEERKCEEIMFA